MGKGVVSAVNAIKMDDMYIKNYMETNTNMNEQMHYFYPNTDNVALLKKIIKEQGKTVCQDKIDQEWIDTSLTKNSFGIAFITKKAMMGRRSTKEADRYYLHGFVLCRSENAERVWIDLVCSRQRSKIGKLLMELAEQKIRESAFRLIELDCLRDVRLKRWYESLGFSGSERRVWDGQLKGYSMYKLL